MSNRIAWSFSCVYLHNADYSFFAITPKFTLTGLVAPERVLYVSQIELFDIYTECK